MERLDGRGSLAGGSPDDTDLTVAQAASEARVSRQTVYDWVGRGHLAVTHDADGSVRIRREDLHHVEGLRRVAHSARLRFATVRNLADGTGDEGGDPAP
jgi:excisionase family DNA binding protein